MEKQTQSQQAQDQQATQQAQTQVYFVTFSHKVSPERARQIVHELRRRFPAKTLVFSPKPQRGKKILVNFNELVAIITIPYPSKQEQSTKQVSMQSQGFTLKELIRNKI